MTQPPQVLEHGSRVRAALQACQPPTGPDRSARATTAWSIWLAQYGSQR